MYHNREVKGMCEDCAYGTGRQGETMHATKPIATISLELEHQLYGKGTSERKGRCQRCWAIDHTERPAERMQGDQLLCHECWLQR